jgi:hypothetical protein
MTMKQLWNNTKQVNLFQIVNHIFQYLQNALKTNMSLKSIISLKSKWSL